MLNDNEEINFVLNLTHLCNMKCNYCYYSDTMSNLPYSMSNKIISDFLLSIEESNTIKNIRILLHGGEPIYDFNLLKHCLSELSQLSKNVNVKIQTNGTLISERKIEEILKIFEPLSFSVSLDGPKDINDRYRISHNDKGSYDSIIRGINILDVLNIRYDIFAVITKKYLSGKEYINFLSTFENLENFRYAINHYVRDDDYSGISDFLCELYLSWIGESNCIFNIPEFSSFIKCKSNQDRETYCTFINNCFRHSNTLFFDCSGDISYCDCGPKIVFGNIYSNTIDDILLNKKIILSEYIQKEDIRLSKCNECKWLKYCNGYCPMYESKPCSVYIPLFKIIEETRF